jgi:hypothetical protein
MWWYPFKITPHGYAVPDSSRPITQADTQPPGEWWGPFHCKDCADTCCSFGKTEPQAYQFNHGTNDEKFAVFLTG